MFTLYSKGWKHRLKPIEAHNQKIGQTNNLSIYKKVDQRAQKRKAKME
jgi:hypothetical protein